MHQHGSKCFADRHPPRALGWGQRVKIQPSQNRVMLHIKLKGMTNAHPRPWVGSKVKTIFF